MSVPHVPPRPARTQQQYDNITGMNIPRIPSRPARRISEHSQSPNRENFPRSPFNEPPLGMSLTDRSGGLYDSNGQNASSSDLPQRPPSVSLPSVGQEGSEYADIDYKANELPQVQDNINTEPQETRNVAGDLPLHAPKPSFSTSTAKRRVSGVTRTDSSQAAAIGIGKAPTPTAATDDGNPQDRILKHKVSYRTASSASTERPASSAEDDHGIPEIGQRVPMYPDAGDVQAPSPSPLQQQFPTGIGFHNAGVQKPVRHHRRTPSGREIIPPGSYGMHGHGAISTDQFEREWYAKHPDALQKEEHGEYGPGIGGGRREWALSSDDLNKLVRETASKVFSSSNPLRLPCLLCLQWYTESSPSNPGLPNEQIGYRASEEYAARLHTPQSAAFRMSHSNNSQPHVESPLRKSSFPIDAQPDMSLQKCKSHDTSSARSTEHALESETEDDETYIPQPTERRSKYTGNGYDPPTEDLGPNGGNTAAEGGYIEERGYGVPILASDEVAKTPGAEYMQPAVSPAQERRGSNYYSAVDLDMHQGSVKLSSGSGSASNSRPTSIHGSTHSLPGLSRFSTHDDDRENMHTPLEDVDEYEPLFSDEEGSTQRKPVTAADRLKLREQMKRFPSQDIWEDTPNSLQLQATVDTPEPANQQSGLGKKTPNAIFETPEQESARKGEVSEAEKTKLIPREERLAKSSFKPHLREEIERPGMRQRFPSRDIWEDSPDSANLSTTVGGSQANDPRIPPDEGLEAGAVVYKPSDNSKVGVITGDGARDGVTTGAPAMEKPSIPPRPGKSKVSLTSPELAQAPPSIPSRPLKRLHQVPPADAPVPILPSKISAEAKQPSPTEARKAPVLPERPRPQVPVRPAKPLTRESSETVPISRIASASSVGTEGPTDRDASSMALPPAPKPKPAVPARHPGGKIASLKGGFLADLDSRLKLGPQGSKPQEKPEEEVEDEKAPLTDARKGRAKGPVRRKPAPSPGAGAAIGVAPTEGGVQGRATEKSWQIQQPWTLWQTDDQGMVNVARHAPAPAYTDPTLADLIAKATPVPTHSELIEKPTEVKEMQRAKLAVEASLQATEPLSQPKVGVPEKAESRIPQSEASLSPPQEVDALVSSPRSTDISPTMTNAQSQTGEKDITVNQGTETEEKTTSIVEEAQGHEGNASSVRE